MYVELILNSGACVIGSKKKKTTTTTTVSVVTKVVKMSYLQTLAVNQGLVNKSDVESSGFDTGTNTTAGSKSNGFFGIGKKSSNTTSQTSSKGSKVKDSWLHPYYDRIRYAVGIRELSVARYQFAQTSEVVSVPYVSPKEIIKMHILVDEYIPDSFDKNTNWIKYYLRVEGSDEWLRVNPINSTTKFNEQGEIVPKILNFNVPEPTTAKLEDKFSFVDSPVKKVRFKAVLSRPDGVNQDSMTPMLKSYRIIMTPRGDDG